MGEITSIYGLDLPARQRQHRFGHSQFVQVQTAFYENLSMVDHRFTILRLTHFLADIRLTDANNPNSELSERTK